ncbi:hypothetical protein GCM10010220_12260 [Streptomyces parvulus]|uniref:Uncharacterized protein n=1 Tax=Streptomyces parvulus TaxID=146923 RepID=A0A191UTS8_9ACTN|nr:hypothetical protein Spa2297_03305 [Streptomyces parvulus]GGR62811.1 hypothetical protein GCM10010220_12260 [Streptomyces parvulus]
MKPRGPGSGPLVTASSASSTPIYDLLITERGNAVAECRDVAQQTKETARSALDWTGVHTVTEERAAFSAFDRVKPPRSETPLPPNTRA